MNMKVLILLCSLVMFYSCQDEENQIPDFPENIVIDVNEDGVDDFLIKYFRAFIHSPTANEAIICEFEILRENKILFKEGEPFLFLNDVGEISGNVVNPLKWSSVDAHLATFEKHFEHGWPSNWKIAARADQSSYFIGIMLGDENTDEIGWIEFEINDQSGEINILETKIL